MARPLIMATLLATAVGAPYLLSKSSQEFQNIQWPWKEKQKGAAAPFASIYSQNNQQILATQQPSQPTNIKFQPLPDVKIKGPGENLFNSPAPIEGERFYHLAEVLRMNVTKDWIYSRWKRKSTGLARPGLYGIRVPLVTGIQHYDLAGSLTYYFNAQGIVQRISFRGHTGDTTQIVQLLTQRYGFRPVHAMVPGEQRYEIIWNNHPQSRLTTRPEPVLWSTSPHASFLVELELERPGSDNYLDQAAKLPTVAGVDLNKMLHPDTRKRVPVFPVARTLNSQENSSAQKKTKAITVSKPQIKAANQKPLLSPRKVVPVKPAPKTIKKSDTGGSQSITKN